MQLKNFNGIFLIGSGASLALDQRSNCSGVSARKGFVVKCISEFGVHWCLPSSFLLLLSSLERGELVLSEEYIFSNILGFLS